MSDEVFVVDRAYEVMTDEELANCIHGATHELFRRTSGDRNVWQQKYEKLIEAIGKEPL